MVEPRPALGHAVSPACKPRLIHSTVLYCTVLYCTVLYGRGVSPPKKKLIGKVRKTLGLSPKNKQIYFLTPSFRDVNSSN